MAFIAGIFFILLIIVFATCTGCFPFSFAMILLRVALSIFAKSANFCALPKIRSASKSTNRSVVRKEISTCCPYLLNLGNYKLRARNDKNKTGFVAVEITGGLAISDTNLFAHCCPRPGGENKEGENWNKEI